MCCFSVLTSGVTCELGVPSPRRNAIPPRTTHMAHMVSIAFAPQSHYNNLKDLLHSRWSVDRYTMPWAVGRALRLAPPVLEWFLRVTHGLTLDECEFG